MKKQVQLQALLKKYREGKADEAERELLENWYIHYGLEAGNEITEQELREVNRQLRANLAIATPEPQMKKPPVKLWYKLAAAAVIVLTFGLGIWYTSTQMVPKPAVTVYKDDIAPGTIGATLTLANGRRINLSEATTGKLAQEAGIQITKTADGELVYVMEGDHSSAGNHYNTLTTAPGQTYAVQLPDGSKVWLNAASTLTYAVSLSKLAERRVDLMGEAYFEVARGSKPLPFVVKTAHQQIDVLGTHFNVNAYTDETATKTTLLEGRVRVSANTPGLTTTYSGLNTILNPGEQSTLTNGQFHVAKVDAQKSIAWKEGKFVFEDETIGSVMRKLARWYNVEVVYEDEVADRTFSGTISRFDNISKILDKISYTNAVHFKVSQGDAFGKGRRVTVMR